MNDKSVTLCIKRQLISIFYRYSTSVYLLVLAVSDTIGLWIVLPKRTYNAVYDQDYLNLSYIHCKLVNWMGYSATFLTALTMINLTIERALLTMFPIRAKLRLTPKVSMLVSMASVLFTQFFTFHLIFSKAFLRSELGNTKNTSSCVFSSKEYRIFQQTTWNYIILICFNLLPIAIIVTGNALIGVTLLKRKRQIYPQSNANHLNLTREKMALRMLFVISLFHILSTTPMCTYLVVKIYSPKAYKAKDMAVDQLVQAILYICIFSNQTFNFLLYFASGSLFREECTKMFISLKNGFHRIYQRRGGSNESENIRTVETDI